MVLWWADTLPVGVGVFDPTLVGLRSSDLPFRYSSYSVSLGVRRPFSGDRRSSESLSRPTLPVCIDCMRLCCGFIKLLSDTAIGAALMVYELGAFSRALAVINAAASSILAEVLGLVTGLPGTPGLSGRGGGALSGSELSHLTLEYQQCAHKYSVDHNYTHIGTEPLPDSEKECWCLTIRDSERSREPSLELVDTEDMVSAVLRPSAQVRGMLPGMKYYAIVLREAHLRPSITPVTARLMLKQIPVLFSEKTSKSARFSVERDTGDGLSVRKYMFFGQQRCRAVSKQLPRLSLVPELYEARTAPAWQRPFA